MRHRRITAILMVLLLLSIAQADDPPPPPSGITFGTEQPVPNPGGTLSKLEGKGTYAVGMGEELLHHGITLDINQGKFSAFMVADYLNGNWAATMVSPAGKVKCWGTMITLKGGKIETYKTAVVEIEVK